VFAATVTLQPEQTEHNANQQVAVSNLIGAIEIVVALIIALGPFSAMLSFIGSAGATEE
jgi:uncharacterized membrane protein YkgB